MSLLSTAAVASASAAAFVGIESRYLARCCIPSRQYWLLPANCLTCSCRPVQVKTHSLLSAWPMRWRLRLLREIFTQQPQAPANRNARSKQWHPWLAACQRKRLRFLRFSFTQRTQHKRLRLNILHVRRVSLLLATLLFKSKYFVIRRQRRTCPSFTLQGRPEILTFIDRRSLRGTGRPTDCIARGKARA